MAWWVSLAKNKMDACLSPTAEDLVGAFNAEEADADFAEDDDHEDVGVDDEETPGSGRRSRYVAWKVREDERGEGQFLPREDFGQCR